VSPGPERRLPFDGWAVALVLLSIPWILLGLGSYSVVNGDEAVYHSIASRMVETGNWLHLEFKGEHRVYDTFMNAPIQYWARASLIALLGSNLFTMRILSALFGVASILMTYRLVLHLTSHRSAFLAGLIQLTTFQFVYLHSARTGELEPVLAFLLTLTALLFLRAVEEKRSWIPHHLCLVLLLNLKLPIVVLPVAAELLWFAITPSGRERQRSWLVTGIAVAPFAFAWHAFQVVLLWGDFQDVLRTMGGQAAGTAGHRIGRPLSNLLFYGRTLLFGAFPYALAYPLALVGVLRDGGDERVRDGWRALALYAAVFLGFFVLVSKHHHWYVIPAYPFLSAFLGAWLGRLAGRPFGWLTLGGIAGVLAAIPWISVDVTAFSPFAERAMTMSMQVQGRSLAGLGPTLGFAATAILLGGALWVGRSVVRGRPGVVVGALTVILIGYGAVRVSVPLAHLGYRSEMARLHDRLQEERRAGTPSDFPIGVREPGRVLALYYFGDDYEILPLRRGFGAAYFLLFERGDPRIIEQSISPQLPTPKGSNVVLISVDTLRWDHLGMYGYARDTTPNLDRVFRGALFENATSPSPCTLPAVPEFLFGRFVIQPDQRSLAQILADAGYSTAAIVSQHQFHGARPIARAVRRGFRHFDIQAPTHVDHHRMTRQRANVVSNRAIEWLENRGGERPFFLWLHYFDPHDPYDPPERFRVFDEGNRSERTGDRRRYLKSEGSPLARWQTAGHIFSEEDVEHLVNLYDGEILFTDSEIGRVLDYLEAEGLMTDSLVFVTSDHGEWLGEDDRWDHCQTLHEREVRVPLMALERGRPLVGGASGEGAVSTLDIVPTVLGVLGIDAPADLEGTDLRSGSGDREVFSVWKGEAAVRSGGWKLISGEDAALYDVAIDPYETVNRIDAGETVRGPLENALKTFAERIGPIEEQDREILEQLRSLGYLDVGEPGP
jgi:arylsulfatase